MNDVINKPITVKLEDTTFYATQYEWVEEGGRCDLRVHGNFRHELYATDRIHGVDRESVRDPAPNPIWITIPYHSIVWFRRGD